MNFDDTHPDYFVDNDDAGRGTVDGGTAPRSEESESDNGGRTISFASSSSSPADGREQSAGGNATPSPRHRRWRRFLMWFVAVAVVVLAVAVWFRYYNPYIEDARMKCYVISVEKRGMVFKTFEADVVSEQSLTDTSRVYSREVSFSVPDATLARRLQEVQGSGRPVLIDYKVYSASLPWRGASKQVVTGVKIE